METINLRINYLAEEYFQGNNVKFASSVNTSEANVRNYRKFTIPKIEFIIKICDFLNINESWLLNGKGNIFKNINYNLPNDNLNIVNEPQEVYGNDILKEKIKLQEETIQFLREKIENLQQKLENEMSEKKLLTDIKKIN